MATFIVTNLNDSGAGSLRDAVAQANAAADADTIKFQDGLAGTVTLTTGEIAITTDVSIDGETTGDNKADITISGNNAGRIFSITGNGTDADLLSLTLTNGNAGAGTGGAVSFDTSGGSLDISDTTFSNNTAASGGALHVGDNNVTVTNSLFTGNSATGDGGAIILGSGTGLQLLNSTVDGNTAQGSGGGIRIGGIGGVALTNSTVTGNLADSDGASTTAGGGISTSSGLVLFYNTVVAGNLSGMGTAANDLQAPAVTAQNSVFGTNVSNVTTGVNGNIESVANVGLGALQDNGGTVLTRNIEADSVLINAGNNSFSGVPATDGNGNARIVAGTVDVGATEFRLVVTTASDVVDANDGLLSLREAVALANADAGADTITFAANLAGQTITLTGSALSLTSNVTIDGDTTGDDRADIIISGNQRYGVFTTGSGADAHLLSLTLTSGKGIKGGAIYVADGSQMEVVDTTITNNVAQRGGGIFAYGSLTVTNSTISGNSANNDGGGVSVAPRGTGTFSNSTIDGNFSGTGGGLAAVGGGTLTLVSSTVTGNATMYAGGGISISGGSTCHLTNTVVALNHGLSDYTIARDSTGFVSADHSFLGTGIYLEIDLGGNINGGGDPLLGALQDNGGTVQTRNIVVGSPLIDAGSNAGASGLSTDANGNPRIASGTVDIGATEVRNLVVTTASDVVDAKDGVLSLREAIALANANADYDIISFDAALAGQTITLTDGELALTGDVSIDGEGNGITISGGNASRIFMAGNGSAGVDVAIRNLTLADGAAQGGHGGDASGFVGAGGGGLGAGGALFVRNGTTVTLTDVTFAGNEATGGNGQGGSPATAGGSGPYTGFGGGGHGGNSYNVVFNGAGTGNGTGGGFGAGGGSGGTLFFAGYGSSGGPGGFGGGAGQTANGYSYATGGGGAGFGGAVFVHDGGSLTIAGGSISGGSVTAGTGFQNGSAAGAGLFLMNETATFAPDAGKTLLIADSIADDFGNGGSAGGSIVMNGAGTLELSGTSTFAGSTTVDDGLLKVTGSIANSEVTVNSGGTIGGSGNTGSLTVNSGGVLSPGSSPGTLHTGDLTLNSGSHFTVEMQGTTAGTDYDQVVVTGSVTLNGATLDLSLLNGFDPVPGDSFTIISNDGADSITGNFSGLTEGSLVSLGNDILEISYKGGDGNDVELKAVELKVTTAGDDSYDGGTLASEQADGGGLSLREAIALANAGANADTITFDTALAGQTITLTGGELSLTNDITIDGDVTGDHKADITISGNGASRIFNANGLNVDVTLRSLSLTNGHSNASGGAISTSSLASLTIIDSTISNSSAADAGGGIAVAGGLSTCNVRIVNSLIAGNSAGTNGGGIQASSSTNVQFFNSTVYGNSADGNGGGIAHTAFSTVAMMNSTVAGNHADADGPGALGGGIYGASLSTTRLLNSVVANNVSGTSSAANDVKGTLTGTSNSFFGTTVTLGSGSTGNINGGGDPLLGELLDNGGTVLTLSPLDGSQLIGAGSNALLPADTYDIDHDGNVAETLPLDGRGGTRVVDGSVDIGVVEQIVNEKIVGTDLANTIVGGLGRDILAGRGGNDTITGGAGVDIIAGGDGADSIDGGSGRDTASYRGSATGVSVDLGGGTASGGHATGDTLTSIENLTGSMLDDTLSGNALRNVLNGLDGADILNGKAGHDTLTGGLGADTFVLTRLGSSSDTITDFETGVDTIQVTAAAAGLSVGTLLASQFAFNPTGAAQDQDDRFVYNTTTGELIFDRNGSDAGGATVIAILQGHPALHSSDIFIL